MPDANTNNTKIEGLEIELDLLRGEMLNAEGYGDTELVAEILGEIHVTEDKLNKLA